MNYSERKSYETPTLNVLGDLGDITKGASSENFDTVGQETSTPNTAFPGVTNGS